MKQNVAKINSFLQTFLYLCKLCNYYNLKHDVEMNAFDRLLKFKIKPSVQRMAIMEFLLENRTHPTVDEIYTALSPFIPTLSKTTVYNTLKIFTEQGAIQTLTIDEKNTCYDVDTSLHSHFLCKRCNKIYDLFDDKSFFPMNTRSFVDGHKVIETHYYYKGYCKECLD